MNPETLLHRLSALERATAFFSYPLSWESLQIDDNHSYWAATTPDYRANPPLRGEVAADLAIIGGGFTGVSTAYHFSRRYPEKKVILLEAKALANGASGRNGGMLLNWITGVDDHSPEMTARIFAATKAAMDTIEGIIHEHRLPVSFRRDGCMTAYTSPARAEHAHREAERLAALGLPQVFLDSAALPQKLALGGVHGAVFDPTEGQLNGAQYVRALKPVLEAGGVQIYEHTPVQKVREGRIIELTTPEGTVKAKAIVLATNAYTGKLGYFRKAFLPLHSHVFATAPLSPEQQAAAGWGQIAGYSDDLDRIAYSVLTKEGNVVFGGGSNASYAYLFNNQTAYPGTPDSAKRGFAAMEKTAYDYLPGLKNIPIRYRWTGTLAISFRRNPSMGVMGEERNIFYALAYNGHGVTLANMAGQVLTDVYSGDDQAWRALPFYQARFDPVPLEPFRWLGYQLITRLTGKSPRLQTELR
jgi:glycine/D-amino acid oxidase-like deaminating enzyme